MTGAVLAGRVTTDEWIGGGAHDPHVDRTIEDQAKGLTLLDLERRVDLFGLEFTAERMRIDEGRGRRVVTVEAVVHDTNLGDALGHFSVRRLPDGRQHVEPDSIHHRSADGEGDDEHDEHLEESDLGRGGLLGRALFGGRGRRGRAFLRPAAHEQQQSDQQHASGWRQLPEQRPVGEQVSQNERRPDEQGDDHEDRSLLHRLPPWVRAARAPPILPSMSGMMTNLPDPLSAILR